MKNHITQPTTAQRSLAALSRMILSLWFFLPMSMQGPAQVQFTQTTDDDFLSGYTDHMLVTGGSVRLQSEATAINPWLSTTDLPQVLRGHQTARWKNLVFLSGGYDGTSYSAAVYRATLQAAGISGWTSLTPLPEALRDHAMVVAVNYLYVIGGRTDGLPSNKIYYAEILADGSLGAWNQSAESLPQPLWGHTAAYQNGYIYVVGGTNQAGDNTAVNTVYYSPVANPYGELSAFSPTLSLPAARNNHSMVTYGNRLVVMGGTDNSATRRAEVYHTTLNLDGSCSAWQQASALLPVAVSHHASVCVNGLMTVMGGENNSSISNKVYFTTADDFPSGVWNTAADSLYERSMDGSAFAASGQLIYSGGKNLGGAVIVTTRYSTLTLGTARAERGTFVSYPFFQLGQERLVEKLAYTLANYAGGNHYTLYYRLAGSSGAWGAWTDAAQANPAMINQTAQYVQYMFRFNGALGDNIEFQSMTLTILGYTQLSGNLNARPALLLSESPYWATGDISFTSGNHLVEPGVTVLFSPNTGLEIGQANMNFGGTAANPIILTSYTAEAGTWNGVFFNANSDNGVSSTLNYVTIQKAGNGTRNANLYCENTNEPHILNSTFSGAVGHGIRLNNADLSVEGSALTLNQEHGIYVQASSPSFVSCSFSNNSGAGVFFADISSTASYFNCSIAGNHYGIYYPSPNYSFATPGGIVAYTNTVSGIAVAGGEVTANQTWHYQPDGYALLGDITIAKQNSTVRLTIKPGNVLRFDTLVQLQVGNYVYYNQQFGGDLYAEGKADSIITFTSLNGQPGGWDGIYFHDNSDSFGSTSKFTYCTIQNGSAYNIKSELSVQPRIDLCTINNSAGYDIFANEPNSVPVTTRTTSVITVGGGTQSINKTWYFFGGEYHVVGDIVVAKQNDRVTLTIQPGNTIRFQPDAMLQIGQYIYYNQQYGGEIYAVGTADSLITFTSMDGQKAGWEGIYFHYNSDSFSSHSFLTYCDIRNGTTYNLKTEDTNEPRIDECTIVDGGLYDIYVSDPNSVPHITSSASTVYINGGTQNIDKTWYNFGGEYIVLSDLIVGKQNVRVRLTLEPGITVKCDTSAMLQIGQYVYYNVHMGGEILAEGTADSLITITSRNGLVGGWDGIYFHDNSDSFGSESFLTYCTITKGKDYNLYCENTVQPRIDRCTITTSGGRDVYALNPNSVPHVTQSNTTVFVGGGTQSINKTWYNFGGNYVVLDDLVIGLQESHCRLTIRPGITVRFNTGAMLQVGQYVYYNIHQGGELYAVGTPDSLITFTALSSITGGWDGINFHYNSDSFGSQSLLKYCVVEEASGCNVYCDGTVQPSFDHVSMMNSGEKGLWLNSSSPYVQLCQVINNDSIGIYLSGTSAPVIGDTLGFGCDLYGNGTYDVVNTTANLIYARNNYWSSTDSAYIAGRIYDHYDNTPYGIVRFMPVATGTAFTNDPPGSFSLVTLPNLTVTSSQHPVFAWEVPYDPNGDPLTYYFYYTDDPTWTTNITVSGPLSLPAYTIPATLGGGKWYWWKVRAMDAFLSTYSDETWTFAVSLPPSVPVPIVPANGARMTENDYLVWLLSTDPDPGDYVSHYHLQIDDNSDFSSPEIDTTGIQVIDKGASMAIRINELPGYLNLENKYYWWRLSAVDGFGIESSFSGGANYFLYLVNANVKVFLEGPFTGSQMITSLNNYGYIPLSQPYNQEPWNYAGTESVAAIPNANVVDWLLLELRETAGGPSTATGATVVYRKAVFLLKNGSLADLDGVSPLVFPVSFELNIYVALIHRNHLAIMSAMPITPNAGSYGFDFSLGSAQVYGGTIGYKEIGNGVWGMISGDGDANGQVNNADKNDVWRIQSGNSGYLDGDFDLNGQVNNIDKVDRWKPNSGKGTQVPD